MPTYPRDFLMSDTYKLRCTPDDRLAWETAAKQEGLSLAVWMRNTLTSAANPPQEKPVESTKTALPDVPAPPNDKPPVKAIETPTCGRFNLPGPIANQDSARAARMKGGTHPFLA